MVFKNTTCLGYTSGSYAYSGNSVVLALKKSDIITAKATRRVASDMKTMSIHDVIWGLSPTKYICGSRSGTFV